MSGSNVTSLGKKLGRDTTTHIFKKPSWPRVAVAAACRPGFDIARRAYSSTSIIRNSAPLGTYSRNMPRALWRPYGGKLFLMGEVPLVKWVSHLLHTKIIEQSQKLHFSTIVDFGFAWNLDRIVESGKNKNATTFASIYNFTLS